MLDRDGFIIPAIPIHDAKTGSNLTRRRTIAHGQISPQQPRTNARRCSQTRRSTTGPATGPSERRLHKYEFRSTTNSQSGSGTHLKADISYSSADTSSFSVEVHHQAETPNSALRSDPSDALASYAQPLFRWWEDENLKSPQELHPYEFLDTSTLASDGEVFTATLAQQSKPHGTEHSFDAPNDPESFDGLPDMWN